MNKGRDMDTAGALDVVGISMLDTLKQTVHRGVSSWLEIGNDP